jgi:hypothetical protein
MSPHTYIIFLLKLAKKDKNEGGIVRVKEEGQQVTHENKMPTTTWVTLKRARSSIFAMS